MFNESRQTKMLTPSPSTPSSYHDDSSDLDELDYRSRKLTKILKKNAVKAEKRKSVLDIVKDRAWLLDDQVKLLEKQTANVRNSLKRQSCKRRLIVIGAVTLSVILLVNRSIFIGIYESIEDFLQKVFSKRRY